MGGGRGARGADAGGLQEGAWAGLHTLTSMNNLTLNWKEPVRDIESIGLMGKICTVSKTGCSNHSFPIHLFLERFGRMGPVQQPTGPGGRH